MLHRLLTAALLLLACAQNVIAAPVVTITAPADNSSYVGPATVTLTADAASSDSTISQVAFYNGQAFIGSTTTAPYTVDWIGVAAGNYSVTAVAIDALGVTTTSSAIQIMVAAAGPVAQVYYIHSDHLDTPRLITDTTNHIVWKWDSDPFGMSLPDENPGGLGMFTYNTRFAGQYQDRETNLYYNYHRDYDPSTGRYVQSDPIGLDGGINTYAYVGSNPISHIDPYGLVEIPKPNPNGVVPGGPWTPAGKGQLPGDYYGPKQPSGGRSICRYVPDEGNGGTPGAKEPYWKTKSPGQEGWNRYNSSGSPITPEEAHPSPRPNNEPAPAVAPSPGWAARIGVGIGLMLYSKDAY